MPVLRIRHGPSNGTDQPRKPDRAVTFLPLEHVVIELEERTPSEEAVALAEDLKGQSKLVLHRNTGLAKTHDQHDRVLNGFRKRYKVRQSGHASHKGDDVSGGRGVGNDRVQVGRGRGPVIRASIDLSERGDLAGVSHLDGGKVRQDDRAADCSAGPESGSGPID